MTRSGRWMWCLPIGVCLVAPVARGQEPTSDLVQVQAVAESIVAREETLSEREFDPVFRAKAKELLAALPLAELVAQTGDDGLGLNALGDTQADLVYTPVTPCRIIDTRLGGGIIGRRHHEGLPRHRDGLLSAQGGSATGCGVPYGPGDGGGHQLRGGHPAGQGSLWVTPYGTPMPVASTINYTTGVNIANGVTVAICNPSTTTCTQGHHDPGAQQRDPLVADVQGYFQRVATGGVGTALLADSAVTAPKISLGGGGEEPQLPDGRGDARGDERLERHPGVGDGDGDVERDGDEHAGSDRGPGRLGQLLGGDDRYRGQLTSGTSPTHSLPGASPHYGHL